jgi:hypothetical protein
MTAADFKKIAAPYLTERLGPLGFAHFGGIYFTRVRSALRDIVFLDLERASGKAFCVVLGVDAPAVGDRLTQLSGSGVPGPMVSRHLGRTDRGGIQKWFRFAKAERLPTALEEMLIDFRDGGLPWLDSLRSVESLAALYYRNRAGPLLPDGTERRADAVAWVVYGWLLGEIGRAHEGAEWLSKARAELAKPLYMKGGQLLTSPAPGAKQVERPSLHRELARILA